MGEPPKPRGQPKHGETPRPGHGAIHGAVIPQQQAIIAKPINPVNLNELAQKYKGFREARKAFFQSGSANFMATSERYNKASASLHVLLEELARGEPSQLSTESRANARETLKKTLTGIIKSIKTANDDHLLIQRRLIERIVWRLAPRTPDGFVNSFLNAYNEIVEVRGELEKAGHEVTSPHYIPMQAERLGELTARNQNLLKAIQGLKNHEFSEATKEGANKFLASAVSVLEEKIGKLHKQFPKPLNIISEFEAEKKALEGLATHLKPGKA